MIELKQQLNEFLSGDELLKKMVVLPKINNNLENVTDRLSALLDVYKFYVPTITTVEIYNRLYLAVLSSLEKKNTIDEVKLLNDNYKSKTNISKRYGIIGGLDSFKILGAAGLGKSSAIQRCIDLISEDNLLINKKPYREIIPILFIECVADGSFKNLLFSILKEIDNRLGTKYFESNNKSTMNVDTLLILTSNVLINHVCVLVIDEIERVANDSRKGDTLINYLTQLVNQSNVAICFVGNISANRYFSNKEYLSRRTIGIEMKKMEYDEHFYKFCKLLFEFQCTKNKVEFNSSFGALLYKLTCGNTAMIISLFIEVQKYTIINGFEEMTEDILKMTFKNYFSTMINHIDIEEIKITKKVKEEPVKLETNNDQCEECLFEQIRIVASKDVDKALFLLKDLVKVEFCTYD